jgi:hypothetical protein
MLPTIVQQRYQPFACGLGVAKDRTTFATKELVYDMLDDRMTESTIFESLERAYYSLRNTARTDYYNFVKSRGCPKQMDIQSYMVPRGGNGDEASPQFITWPQFDNSKFGDENIPPKDDAIAKMAMFYFDVILEQLKRDLYSRPPGRPQK